MPRVLPPAGFDHDVVVPGHRVGATEDRWYSQNKPNSTSLTNSGLTSDKLRAFPFVPSKDMTLDRIAFRVNSALAGFARVGVYNDNGNLYPSSLIVDGGSIDTGTTGEKVSTISVPVLGGELYWLAYSSSVSVSVRAIGTTDQWPILGWEGGLSFTAPGTGWDATFPYAALPAAYPAGAAVYTAIAPVIFVRGT